MRQTRRVAASTISGTLRSPGPLQARRPRRRRRRRRLRVARPRLQRLLAVLLQRVFAARLLAARLQRPSAAELLHGTTDDFVKSRMASMRRRRAAAAAAAIDTPRAETHGCSDASSVVSAVAAAVAAARLHWPSAAELLHGTTDDFTKSVDTLLDLIG